MPSQMFAHISDEDLASVIAFVRTAPVLDGPMRDVTMRPLGRIGIVTGKFKPLASTIPHDQPHAAKTDKSDPLAFGEYLVMTTCTECHGRNLQGDDFLKAPGLTVLAGYSDEAFRRLMKTGLAIGDRKLGLMTEVGLTRFPQLTEEELNAMTLYLRRSFGGLQVASEPAPLKPTAAHTETPAADRS
jgi:mono/diheme cytochrome c family protein